MPTSGRCVGLLSNVGIMINAVMLSDARPFRVGAQIYFEFVTETHTDA